MRLSFPIILIFCLHSNFSIAKQTYFAENKGQIDKSVLFYHQSPNLNILLYSDGFGYDNFKWEDGKYAHHRVEIRFQDANKNKSIERIRPLGFYENFYREYQEILKVQSYEVIVYKDLYKNIDLRFTISESGFKYDVIVHPGGNISDVSFKVEGAPVNLRNHQLSFELDFGKLEERIPESYIEETGEPVLVNYIEKKNGLFGFAGYNSNSSQTLVIDPVPNRVWGTYYGGTNVDESYGSAMDSSGFIYQTGKTLSNSNISTSGAFQTTLSGNYDGYLAKFDTSGKLIWATYYGSSSEDNFKDIEINNLNEILLVGNSSGSSGLATSGAYRTSNAGGQDGLLVKFSTSGARIWATYFGGGSTEDLYRITSDVNRNVYVGGKSSSTGLATSGAHQTTLGGGEDGLLFSFDDSGGFRWATYLGGSSQDYFWDLTFNNDQYIYATGHTFSSSGISLNAKHQSTYGGNGDVFFAKIDVSGKFSWSNYFGGTGLDLPIEMTNDGIKLYSVGQTTSTSSIASSGAYKTSNSGNTDGYVLCFDTSGQRSWATYIGDNGIDEAYSIIYANHKLFVAGKTSSSSGIASSDAFQLSNGGGQDCFIMKLDMNGYVLWGTYYGGSGNDRTTSIRYFWGALYLNGATYSTSNIATSGTHKTTQSGSEDAFIAKFDNLGCDMKFFGKMVRPTLCQGDSNGIAAVVFYNNSGNPTVRWKTSPPQYNDTAFGLPSGVYEVVVSDTFGCLDSVKVFVLSPVRVSAFVRDSVHISCNGRKDGILVADAIGGTQPYFFRWLTTPNVTDDSLTGLGVGTYKVLVTDNNNCRDSATARITEPEQLKTNITGYSNPTCFLLNNGQISVTATGGTQPYSYSWSTSPVQKTSKAYNITAGYYEVTVTDKNGCTSKSSFTLTEPSPITIGLTGLDHSLCYNDSLGSISTLIWGGTPGYKLEWNNNPSLDKNNLTKLRGGSYRLSVTDANNCLASRTFVINEPNPLVINFDSMINPKCYGSTDGRISASVGGGTPSYKLSWNTPPYNDVYQVSGLKAGLYILNVKDSFGCVLSDTVVLQSADSLSVNANITMPKCFDGNDGKITTEVKGGTLPYKYRWSHDTTLNHPDAYNLKAGTYLLTITDAFLCVHNNIYIVREPDTLKIHLNLTKHIRCFNQNDGAISVSISGGTLPYDLQWNTNPPSRILSLDSLKAGKYNASVTDQNGCADSLQVILTEPLRLTGTFDSLASPNCFQSPTGFVRYKAGGGVRPYKYSFNFTSESNDSFNAAVKAGMIHLKLTDANGCVLYDSVQLIDQKPLSISADVRNVKCFDTKTGSIFINAQGGVLPYEYNWSPTFTDTNYIDHLDIGIYSLTLKDRFGCLLKDSFLISQPTKLTAKKELEVPVSCYGRNNGIAAGSASGGMPGYRWFWNTTQRPSSSQLNDLYAGRQVLYVMDSFNCIDSLVFNITEPARIKAMASQFRKPTCVGWSDGRALATPIPGVGPYLYKWSDGQTVQEATGLAKGNYTVIITDACGDTANASVTIEDPEPFIIPNILGVGRMRSGQSQSYEMKFDSSWKYNWEITGGEITSGQGTNKVLLRWTHPNQGIIKVTVINGQGCTDEVSMVVDLFVKCLEVYPNPSSELTHVFSAYADGTSELEAYDALGRKVMSWLPAQDYQIDVSGWARGIYFFRYKDCVIKFLKD